MLLIAGWNTNTDSVRIILLLLIADRESDCKRYSNIAVYSEIYLYKDLLFNISGPKGAIERQQFRLQFDYLAI